MGREGADPGLLWSREAGAFVRAFKAEELVFVQAVASAFGGRSGGKKFLGWGKEKEEVEG